MLSDVLAKGSIDAKLAESMRGGCNGLKHLHKVGLQTRRSRSLVIWPSLVNGRCIWVNRIHDRCCSFATVF